MGYTLLLIEIDCGEPPALPNARLTFTSTDYLANATYECNDQYYKEQGNTTFFCTSAMFWSGDILVCKGKIMMYRGFDQYVNSQCHHLYVKFNLFMYYSNCKTLEIQ